MSSKTNLIMLFSRSHCRAVGKSKGSSVEGVVKRMFSLRGMIYFILLAILEEVFIME